MRIHTGGNVGIGTDSPDSTLDISRGTDTTGYSTTGDQRGEATITVRNASETAGTFAGINFYAGAGTGSDWSINNVRTGSYVGDLTFKTRAGGGSTDWRERMRIKGNGNVGIGISSPIGKLDIKSTSSTRNLILKEDEGVGDGSYGPHYEYKVAYIAGNSLNTQLTIPFTSRSYNQTGYFKIRVIPALHNLTTVTRVATAEFALGLSYPNVVSIGSVLSSSGNYSSSSAGVSYLRIVFSNNYSNGTMNGAFIHMEFFGQQGTSGAPDYANISFN
jgi:hypothetical protein